MIPDEAVEAALDVFWAKEDETYLAAMRAALEAAAPHMATFSAVAAVHRLHRAMPCVDEDGDQIGGFYCEECKDLDDHSGERVHEVYPCLTVREIEAALAEDETFTAMRDRIETEATR